MKVVLNIPAPHSTIKLQLCLMRLYVSLTVQGLAWEGAALLEPSFLPCQHLPFHFPFVRLRGIGKFRTQQRRYRPFLDNVQVRDRAELEREV